MLTRRITKIPTVSLWALFGALALTSASDASEFRSPGRTAYVETGTPVTGGELTFGLEGGGLPNCTDPQLALANSPSYVSRPLADSLLDQDIETKEFHPWLATAWDVNDTGTVYSFTLREGVTFSDGSPLTPETVKKNFDSIVNNLGAQALYAYGFLAHYDETVITGPNTFEVKFKQPNAAFLQGTATLSLAILSDATTELSREDRCSGKLIGTGPFKITEYIPDNRLVLDARDDYSWPSALSANQGRPYLDRVIFRGISSDSSRLGALLAGQIDLYNVVVQEGINQLRDGGFRVVDTNNGGVPVAFFPSVTDGLASDIDIRKAVQIGIDRQEIYEHLIADWFDAATGSLTPITPSYVDQSEKLKYDPEQAKAILDAAGWVPGSDGIREKDGQKLVLKLIAASYFNNSPTIFQQVALQLQRIGIDFQIFQATPAQISTYPHVPGYDFVWYNGRFAEPDQVRTIFGVDYSNYNKRTSRADFDDELEQQLTIVNPEERFALLAQIQNRLIDEALIIPIYNWAQSVAHAPYVHGIYFRPLGGPGVDLHTIWVDGKGS